MRIGKNYGHNAEEVIRLDAELHDYIISHCGNKVMVRIMSNARLQFMEWSITNQWGYHDIKPHDTHREILDVIRTRDRLAARQAMERHLARSREVLLAGRV